MMVRSPAPGDVAPETRGEAPTARLSFSQVFPLSRPALVPHPSRGLAASTLNVRSRKKLSPLHADERGQETKTHYQEDTKEYGGRATSHRGDTETRRKAISLSKDALSYRFRFTGSPEPILTAEGGCATRFSGRVTVLTLPLSNCSNCYEQATTRSLRPTRTLMTTPSRENRACWGSR